MASPPSPEEMDETRKKTLEEKNIINEMSPEFIKSVQPMFEEMLKQSETQRDDRENSNIQLEEQRNEISSLSARSKKPEDELRKKDEFLYNTVKDISEVPKKSLNITERLGTKFQIYMVEDDRLKEIQMLRQQCKTLEKSLPAEMKSHNRLLMKINKNMTSILNKQDEFKKLWFENESKQSNVNSSSLPQNILGVAYRIEKEFVNYSGNKYKIKQFGLALGLKKCRVEEIVNEETGNLFWEVLYEWSKTSHCLAVLINACQRLSISSLSDGYMPPHHSTAIEKAYSRLEANILFEPVVTYLRDYAVLTPIDVDYILSPETRTEKFRRLIDILPLFGEKAFDCLVVALIKSHQNHLAVILKDEQKELTPVSEKRQRELTSNNEFRSLNEREQADFDLSSFILILLLDLLLFIVYKIW